MDWTWEGQWALNAWPNIALTIVLLCVTVWWRLNEGFLPWIFSRLRLTDQ